MSLAWFPFYPSDYVGKTLHLTTVEHGAYLLLMMHYYNQGGLPADDGSLAAITKMRPADWRKIRPKIAGFFEAGWRHERIESEMERAREKSSARAEAGSRGGRAKALKSNDKPLANATILPEQNPAVALASSSQPQSQPQSTPSSTDEGRGMTPNQLYEILVKAANGNVDDQSLAIQTVAPILNLIRSGYDLHEDILPVIRQTVPTLGGKLRTWGAKFIVQGAQQAKANREALARIKAPAPAGSMVLVGGRPVAEDLILKAIAEWRQKPISWRAYEGLLGQYPPDHKDCELPARFRPGNKEDAA